MKIRKTKNEKTIFITPILRGLEMAWAHYSWLWEFPLSHWQGDKPTHWTGKNPPSGAWFPLEVAGEAFSAIGHVLPTAWAMDGFQNLIVRGQSFQSVLMPAGILSLYTLVFIALAVWRFDS